MRLTGSGAGTSQRIGAHYPWLHPFGITPMRRAVLAFTALAIAAPAQAASFGIISFAGSTPIISLAGPIALGDDVKFDDFARALRYPAIVRLSSYGGNTMAALAIGREIAKLGYTTYVADSEVCASACGLIWLAGRQRYSGPKALIGLHATYLQQDGKNVETSPGNALVGKYLGELGYQDDFVVYATSAAPADMAWLNRGVTDHFNIAWETREQDVATLNTLDVPAQSPTPNPPGPVPMAPPQQLAPVAPSTALPPAVANRGPDLPIAPPPKPAPKPQRREDAKLPPQQDRGIAGMFEDLIWGAPPVAQQHPTTRPVTHQGYAPATE